jgi:superfamily II DNA/RNA helicase
VQEGLKQHGIDHGLFIGKGNPGVTEAGRQKDVKDFNAGKRKVIVLSGAGSEGISFPNATAMYTYDSHFNPERILQAEARAVRSGGQKHRPADQRKVEIRRFVTAFPKTHSWLDSFLSYFGRGEHVPKDTVEEWILRRADGRHRVNQQLYDIIANKPKQQHSLFEPGQAPWELAKASAVYGFTAHLQKDLSYGRTKYASHYLADVLKDLPGVRDVRVEETAEGLSVRARTIKCADTLLTPMIQDALEKTSAMDADAIFSVVFDGQ